MEFTLEDVKRVYGESRWGYSDYSAMIELFGENIVQCDENGYQGDTIAVIKKNGKYGYLVFGWGSCSGCDALQACETIQEVFDLAKGMWESIKWYDSEDEIKTFVNSHDYKGDWLDDELVEEFKAEFKKAFSAGSSNE